MRSEGLNIGDLVICKYDFEELYRPSTLPFHKRRFFMGIVVQCRRHTIYPFGRDIVYDVLCTDGVRRSFMKWEIEAVG